MRVLANIFVAMQSAWLNGRRRRQDTLRQLISASGLWLQGTDAASKGWPHRRRGRGV